jgi:formate dehydrogenase maturation protein FdhE
MIHRIAFRDLFDDDADTPRRELTVDPFLALQRAEVIDAIDTQNGEHAILFGRRLLEKIITTGKGRRAVVLEVEINWETDELERLIELAALVKGRCDLEVTPICPSKPSSSCLPYPAFW